MKITPKTDAQIAEENLWPAGEYDFSIHEAEDTISKTSGKPMIKLRLTAFSPDGKQRTITDYLMESMAYKLKHCLYAIGMGKEYEAGEFDAASLQGRSGRVLLKQEFQDGFAPKNSVKDYVVLKEGETAAPAARPAAASAVTAGKADDGIPF